MKTQILKPLSLALMFALVPLSVSTAHTVDKSDKGGKGNKGPAVHVIGDSYQGGIVFYVDDEGQHGLIAAKVDQSTGIQWGTDVFTGTTGDGLGAGAMDTTLIVARQISFNQTGEFAAKVAADYSVQEDGTSPCMGLVSETCYGDWYLPSKAELNLLYTEKTVVGGFADGYYWSSTELRLSPRHFMFGRRALAIDFANGTDGSYFKSLTNRVRAVRAF